MSRRIDHSPIVLRVPHTCRTHDARVGEFTATTTYRFDDGSARSVVTRCDGTQMDVWHDEPGVEVVAKGAGR